METNNIMENAIEETVKKAPNKFLIGGGIAGGILLIGGLTYKVHKVITNKKNQKAAEAEIDAENNEVEVEE